MVEEYETYLTSKGSPTIRERSIPAFPKTYALPYFTKNKISREN